MKLATVILAAGLGTRMKSDLPKVLFPVAGKAMVHYALDAASALGSRETVLVVGHGADQVREEVGKKAVFVLQGEQLGTGHAVLQAREALQGRADTVLVMYGDMPLLRAETLQRLAGQHARTGATITMVTVRSDESMGFGRILRDANGRIQGIVEEREATPEQLEIHELNCGVYCFHNDWMWEHLPRLTPSAKKGEYYLTDLVGMAVQEACTVESVTLNGIAEAVGVNTRAQLAEAERIMRGRINDRLMEEGITLVDPATAYIDADVLIGVDTIIEPNTHLKGRTRIGADCRVGPNSIIRDSEIGDRCEIVASVVELAVLETDIHVGPFSHLRPGAYLARNVHIGNYAEIKNSHLGEQVHVGHFSYIGDSEVGARSNIGAGAITCNYDGEKKNRTIIGEDAFIGSDTMLVAPVRIGDRARTGAGSVVNKDVPADTLAVGLPARVIRRLR
ncbi:MAG: bifunctional UDP-N-acetylglucosamine diphosphorylase/glucosamine-1-phosphate N-acetyltransferase GlmU [Chloroflexi bacterium]|nr:bifunctional UDP-N-acetylglucosamine diphosphorylase/glucosamine-1-phosphate N-acetyltransferase GlmU [Chloroflexota bacterium]